MGQIGSRNQPRASSGRLAGEGQRASTASASGSASGSGSSALDGPRTAFDAHLARGAHAGRRHPKKRLLERVRHAHLATHVRTSLSVFSRLPSYLLFTSMLCASGFETRGSEIPFCLF